MRVILPAATAATAPQQPMQQYSIYVDARMIHHTGIGRYIREHLKGFSKRGLRVCACVGSEEGREEVLRAAPTASIFLSKAAVYGAKERFRSALGINVFKDECDVFWFPQYNTPWRLPSPSVVTLHDLIQFRYNLLSVPGWKLGAARRVLKNATRRATRIVCVSHTTKADLLESDSRLESKVGVVLNGVSDSWSTPTLLGRHQARELLRGRPCLLSVSQKKPHKNQKLLLELMDRLYEASYPHVLALVGQNTDEWKATFDAWAATSKASSRVLNLDEIEDEFLAGLYQEACVFLFPSLYEGFGLPVLEAMAAGTPVVVSNRGALPETVGGAGELVDPLDVDAWEEEVCLLLDSKARQEELARLGRIRASELTWDRQTAELLQVLDTAVCA